MQTFLALNCRVLFVWLVRMDENECRTFAPIFTEKGRFNLLYTANFFTLQTELNYIGKYTKRITICKSHMEENSAAS